jgi:hypothetical protein
MTMTKVKVLQDTKRLVQLQLPKEFPFAGFLEDKGGFCVFANKNRPRPSYFNKCSRPKCYLDTNGKVIRVGRRREGNLILPVVELSVFPSMFPLVVPNVSFALFGGPLGIKNLTVEFTAAKGRLELAKRISDTIDCFLDSHKCRRVYVVYRQLPTVIPCDDGGKAGAVVYVELGMMGE